MPRRDRTGPMGRGSMTGRAAGYCAGWGLPGFTNYGTGRGLGTGFGRGCMFRANRGPGWDYGNWLTGSPGHRPLDQRYDGLYAQSTPEAEQLYLQDQEKILKHRLNEVKNRLDELASQNKTVD